MEHFLRSYKFRIFPTSLQKQLINSVFAKCRFVFNKILHEKKEGKIRTIYARSLIPRYLQDYSFLQDCDYSALMNVGFLLSDVSDFSKVHYKSPDDFYQSYSTGNYRNNIRILDDSYITLPYVGNIKIRIYRPLPENASIHKVTVIRDLTGNYSASILIDLKKDIPRRTLSGAAAIGLDYSQSHFFVDSNGRRADIPHFFQNMSRRIREEKKKLYGMKAGSKNYDRQNRRIERLRLKAINQRKDCLQKLSTAMADSYDIICVEKLTLDDFKHNPHYRKNLYDNGYGLFLEMLKYKMDERGKLLVMLDPYFASTKRCSRCGTINNNIRVGVETWTCAKCGTVHDRDTNAAVNIKIEGLRSLKKTVG